MGVQRSQRESQRRVTVSRRHADAPATGRLIWFAGCIVAFMLGCTACGSPDESSANAGGGKAAAGSAAPMTVGLALLGNRFSHLGYNSCQRPPRGGLGRVVAWLSDASASQGWDAQVVLGVGNDLGSRVVDEASRDPYAAAETILRAYGQLRVDAVGLAQSDVSGVGLESLTRWAEAFRVPLVAANLIDRDSGGPASGVARARLIEVGTRSIAFVSVASTTFGADGAETGDRYRFDSPLKRVGELLATDAIASADLTVVAADVSDGMVIRMLKEQPSIDVLVRTARQSLSQHPEFQHGAMVVDIGQRGEQLPLLEVRFAADSKPELGVADGNLRARLEAEFESSRTRHTPSERSTLLAAARQRHEQADKSAADAAASGLTLVNWRVVPLTLDLPSDPAIEARTLELTY